MMLPRGNMQCSCVCMRVRASDMLPAAAQDQLDRSNWPGPF